MVIEVFLLAIGITLITRMGVVNDQSTILSENWSLSTKHT